MLGPGQLTQGWEERGSQTAKMVGGGGEQAGPGTQKQGGVMLGQEQAGDFGYNLGLRLRSRNQASTPRL